MCQTCLIDGVFQRSVILEIGISQMVKWQIFPYSSELEVNRKSNPNR